MIRWISLVFLLTVWNNVSSQDLFNLENSRKFANYLFDSGQFDLAADEFERVVFLDNRDSVSVLKLLKSYHLQGNYKLGLKRANKLLPDLLSINKSLAKEYIFLNFKISRFDESNNFIKENRNLSSDEKKEFLLSSHLLARDWISAERLLSDGFNPQNTSFTEKADLLLQKNQIQSKHAYLAASLSMIIPGSGKIYTGNWQDGLISFLFVATNAWQAYRGFNKDGINSTSGWIFGGLGLGFYIGNIYGSYRSAIKYNNNKKEKFHKHVEKLVYSTF